MLLSQGSVNAETVQALLTQQVLRTVCKFWESETIEGAGGKDLQGFLHFCMRRSIGGIEAAPNDRFPPVYVKENHT